MLSSTPVLGNVQELFAPNNNVAGESGATTEGEKEFRKNLALNCI